jgi:tetratricopeptide (TPR) repeat protein
MSVPRSLRLLALLCAAAGASGCATLRAECRDHAGVEWREVRTEHFRIQTDLSSDKARQAAQELERFRRALGSAFTTVLDPPGQLQVVLLRDQGELREFAGANYLGLYSRAGTKLRFALSSGRSSAPGLDGASLPTVQRHELAHFLMSHAFPRQPRWFSEGMAQYLQTVAILPEGNAVRFGDVVAEAVLYTRARSVLPLEALWAWEGLETDGRRGEHLYASAWAYVHYLMNAEPERFGAFMARLSRAQEPRQAWSAAFAGVDVGRLEGAVRGHVENGTFYTQVRPVTFRPAAVQERPMSPADVHVARALLHHMTAGSIGDAAAKRDAVQQELAQALRMEPDNVAAALLAAETLPGAQERVAPLRALAQSRPEDGEVWGAYAEALVEAAQGRPGPESDAVLARAAHLLPDDAGVQTALAMHELTRARLQPALAASERAVKMAPWNPMSLHAYAFSLAATGRCADAVSIYKRLLDVLPETVPEAVREQAASQVDVLRTQCRPSTSGNVGTSLR